MAFAVDVVQDNGYRYVQVSAGWKQMCSVLPCFDRVRFPDYGTKYFPATIGGQPMIVQLWKGSCPQLLGNANMPGGIGAEVGLYRYYPEGTRPDKNGNPVAIATEKGSTLADHRPKLPAPARVQVHQASNALNKATHGAVLATHNAAQVVADKAKDLAAKVADAARDLAGRGMDSMLADRRLWWPVPECQYSDIRFELLFNGKTFFKTGVTRSYWQTQWMDKDDYKRFQKAHPDSTPQYSNHFTQRFWINGLQYPDWVGMTGAAGT